MNERYVEFTSGGIKVDVARYLKSDHGKEALRKIEKASKRFEMSRHDHSYFLTLTDKELIEYCCNPPKDCEFNELKEAAHILAMRYSDLRVRYYDVHPYTRNNE
jgi:tRNA U34 2-thiouridine synthase MnmA/TrmU